MGFQISFTLLSLSVQLCVSTSNRSGWYSNLSVKICCFTDGSFCESPADFHDDTIYLIKCIDFSNMRILRQHEWILLPVQFIFLHILLLFHTICDECDIMLLANNICRISWNCFLEKSNYSQSHQFDLLFLKQNQIYYF